MNSSDCKSIVWITPDCFLDTDVRVLDHLSDLYHIRWFIIRPVTIPTGYEGQIEDIKKKGTVVDYFQIHKKGMDPRNLIRFYKLAKIVRNSKAEFVYTCLAYPFYYLPLMAHIIGTDKIVLAIHNARVPKGGSNYFRNKLYNAYAIRRFKHFQTFSKSQYDYLNSKNNNKGVTYIPFYPKDYGKPKNNTEKSEQITLLNFGYIREYKRIDVLIKAAQKAFLETGKLFKVIIAGECADWSKYQSIIEFDQLFDLRIRRIENDEIPNLFAEADYFVAPYQDIAQSGSVIVALTYAVPVIASRLPAFEEYIKDNETGFLIDSANENDLEKTIEYILQNHDTAYPEMKKKLCEYNKQIFDESKITNCYKELINGIIGQ